MEGCRIAGIEGACEIIKSKAILSSDSGYAEEEY